jgi:hypothetical protein
LTEDTAFNTPAIKVACDLTLNIIDSAVNLVYEKQLLKKHFLPFTVNSTIMQMHKTEKCPKIPADCRTDDSFVAIRVQEVDDLPEPECLLMDNTQPGCLPVKKNPNQLLAKEANVTQVG